MTAANSPLNPVIASALAERGYTDLTPVQVAVTDPALQDADLLVSAQTGSGKTVGFGLAIAPTLLDGADRFDLAAAPLALVIAPTRELALQVRRELEWLYAGAGAVLASCVGGMDMRDERRALDRGAHIVVATPGRLRDHITRGSMDMTALRAVVLDEADEMLDLGFREDLEFILGEAPESRRTLMFSATVPRAIAKLAESYQKDARRITTVAEKTQHADIDYRAMNVAAQDAENAVVNVLRFYESQNAIVFGNTRAMVARMTTRLSNRGFAVVALSGELSQQERSHALQSLRDGRARVCVATDVAARGIDLPNLDLVVHAELPNSADTLLHRSGRTGRAGRKGVSALIVPPGARRKAENLLKFAKVNAVWEFAPSADAVHQRDEERLLSDPVWTSTPTADEAAFATKLQAQFSAGQIAAAYFRLYRSRQSAPEDLSTAQSFTGTGPTPDRPRAEFGPSVWFSVSTGRNQRTEARWLMPMLCRAGNITRTEIGAIRIQADETYVEISQPAVSGFLGSIGPGMVLERGLTITELSAPPVLDRGPRNAIEPAAERSAPERVARPERAERPEKQFTGARAAREYKAMKPKTAEAPLPVHIRKSDAATAKPPAAKRPKWSPESAPARPAPAKVEDTPAMIGPAKPKPKTFGKPAAKPAGKPFGKPFGKGADKPKAGKPKAAAGAPGKPKALHRKGNASPTKGGMDVPRRGKP
ncbi:MAG: DEAD/DEAH box helicase [Paracoccaceae bacterium]